MGSARRWLMGVAVVVGVVALAAWTHRRLTSAALFLRFEGGEGAPAWLSHYSEEPLTERFWRLPWGQRGRLYLPRKVKATRGLVLVHGMHEGGIDEPRLAGFARAIASTGVVVGTPELQDLKRFRVTRADVTAVADAAKLLAHELGRKQVAVFGVSFGGGLALRAACESGLAVGIGRVIALGAPEDLGRVAEFALGKAPRGPNGELPPKEPHPYARKALESFLFGAPLSLVRSAKVDALIESTLKLRAAELRALSPSGCPGVIHVPVHLAHGLGDNIIPYTETLWLARSLRVDHPPEVLVSPAIGHAEYTPPTWRQRFQLVEFMAKASDW